MTAVSVKEPMFVRPPIRRLITVRRAVVAAVVLLALLAAGWFVALPLLLRRAVDGALRDAGVREGVHYRVDKATPWGSRLTHLAAGSAVTIKRVDLNYSLRDLWHGRIDAIRLIGANITLAVNDGAVDLAPITSLVSFTRTARARGSAPPTAAAPAATRPAALPLELFTFTDSRLTFVTPQQRVEIPVSGSMMQEAPSRLNVRLDAGEKRSLLLNAAIDLSAKQVTFEGGAHAGQTLSVIRAIWPGVDTAVAGRLLLNGQANWGDDFAANARLQISESEGEAISSDYKLQLSRGVLEVDVAGPSNRRRVRLTVKDAAIVWSKDFVVEAAGGEVVLTQLTPPRTLPRQLLTAGLLKIGDMRFTDGELEFEMTEGRTMLINQTRWSWLGGQASASEVRVGPGVPFRATLQIRNVDLKELLAAYSSDKLDGEGKLSGQLPIEVTGGRVNIGSGQLTSLQGGQLRIKDRAMIDQVAAQAGASQQVKQSITEALADFVYDRMSVQFVDRPDGLLTRVQFGGQGRTGSKQEMTFDLRITGLEDLLNSYLRIQSALSAARERAEKAGRP